MQTVKHNLHQLLIAIDQFFNVLLGSIICPRTKSWADETLSSRCWRASQNGYDLPRNIVDGIFFFDKNHCQESYISEKEDKHLPPECRS